MVHINAWYIYCMHLLTMFYHVRLGYADGRLEVLRTDFRPNENSVTSERRRQLFGHCSRIVAIEMCAEFGIAVTAESDENFVIWDLGSLSYIRTVPCKAEVKHLTISATSGDIAVACGSSLSIFSINGTLAGTVSVEPHSDISSLTMSHMTEGVACNVVVTGHSDGIIRFWSSWDLAPVRELRNVRSSPIIALAYSVSNENLFAATDDGLVLIFEKAYSQRIPPKFSNLAPLLD